ncbi:MAG: hypothetical protein AAGF24_00910 [Cyanobacteria bacterium P01_H01_bin.121]
MGLFDQIAGAISNPQAQASTGQLGSLLGVVQQLAGNQTANDTQTQAVMSVVGSFLRSSLQQQRSSQGAQQVEQVIDSYGGTTPNAAAVQALLSPQQQQQLAQTASAKTGLDAQMIQSMLPALIPVALNFLKMGSANAPNQAAPQTGGNSVLNSFLDADGDGDVDMGDMLANAQRFL